MHACTCSHTSIYASYAFSVARITGELSSCTTCHVISLVKLLGIYTSGLWQAKITAQVTELRMLQSLKISLSLVILVGLVQDGNSHRGRNLGRREGQSQERCRSYAVSKIFNLRDSTTNDLCTLRFYTHVCGGYCESKARVTIPSNEKLKADQSGTYQLSSPVDVITDCKCCEPVHKERLYTFQPMELECLQGQKWNETVKIKLLPPSSECICRPCRPPSVPIVYRTPQLAQNYLSGWVSYYITETIYVRIQLATIYIHMLAYSICMPELRSGYVQLQLIQLPATCS